MNNTSGSRLSVTSLYLFVTVFFWLSVLGLAIGLPAGIIGTATSDHPMSIHATVPAKTLGDLPWRVDAPDRVAASIPIDHLSTAQIVAFHSAIALAGLAFLFAFWQLRQLVGSVRAGDPFSTDNVRRLRILGGMLLIGFPVFQYVMAGLNEWILTTGGPDLPSVRVDIDLFSITALFGALCLLVLAEVFARGITLREDVEATV
ncbi:MAG: hypothetical protein QOG54_1453 [Actinomycetota bacterium]|jgi:hypothetical protein|nr:hypothetical protein [Actinomycetota bacterium]